MSDAHEDDGVAQTGGYELVMPFVVCASNGGPYDDDAYAAGWELGRLDALLQLARQFHLGPPITTIHRANMPQAELLAMKQRMHLKEIPFVITDADTIDWAVEWAPITFTYIP